MSFYKIQRLIRLNGKAERHSSEHKRLLGDRSAQAKALWHLQKAELLYSQISGIIKNSPFRLRAGSEGNLPDSGFPACLAVSAGTWSK